MDIYLLEDDAAQLAHLVSLTRQITNELGIDKVTINAFQTTDQLRLALPLPSPENVFILDLEINGYRRAGLDFSERIRKLDTQASIIFMTIHDELLYRTFKSRTRALDFIAKDQGNVFQELKKDFRQIQGELTTLKHQEYFTYTFYNDKASIPLNNVCFFESSHLNSHSSALITTDNQRIQLNYNLRELSKMNDKFYRAHRSYLVNIDQVKNIDLLNMEITFRNHMTCPVSRRRARDLYKLIDKDL